MAGVHSQIGLLGFGTVLLRLTHSQLKFSNIMPHLKFCSHMWKEVPNKPYHSFLFKLISKKAQTQLRDMNLGHIIHQPYFGTLYLQDV